MQKLHLYITRFFLWRRRSCVKGKLFYVRGKRNGGRENFCDDSSPFSLRLLFTLLSRTPRRPLRLRTPDTLHPAPVVSRRFVQDVPLDALVPHRTAVLTSPEDDERRPRKTSTNTWSPDCDPNSSVTPRVIWDGPDLPSVHSRLGRVGSSLCYVSWIQ